MLKVVIVAGVVEVVVIVVDDVDLNNCIYFYSF